MFSLITVVSQTVLWAAATTVVVMLSGVPLAYLLARRPFPGRRVVSALTSLPLVLPPTAVGYLLLRLLADRGPLGRETLGFDLDVLLTWKGVIAACSVMSLPLVVRTAKVAFEEVDPGLETMARTLGLGPTQTWFRVTLPLAARGLMAAAILGFTRAMGEFGATVIVAGNIPGKTQTLPAAIYSAQQAGHAGRADLLVLVALVVGFAAIFTTEVLAHPARRGRSGRSPSNPSAVS